MFQEFEEEDEPRRARWLRNAGLAALCLGLVGAIAFLLLHVESTPHRPPPQFVINVRPPPPPPPPPPKPLEPKPVEPPKFQELKPIQQVKPQDKPAPKAPPAQRLTAEAGPGNNPYGLAVGNGEGNVIGGGEGEGGGGNTYGRYAGLVQSQVQGALKREEKTRFGRYHVSVRLWLGPGGQVTRAQIASSSGDPAVDSAITGLLSGLSFGEAPPAGMPQPIHLRIGAEPG